MSKKRKTPLFSAIVLRVLEIRFKEIVRVKLVSQTVFELVIKSRADGLRFSSEFDSYMVHLVSEFGEPELAYSFRIFQSARLIVSLNYNEVNNSNEINVNLYQAQNHGN